MPQKSENAISEDDAALQVNSTLLACTEKYHGASLLSPEGCLCINNCIFRGFSESKGGPADNCTLSSRNLLTFWLVEGFKCQTCKLVAHVLLEATKFVQERFTTRKATSSVYSCVHQLPVAIVVFTRRDSAALPALWH